MKLKCCFTHELPSPTPSQPHQSCRFAQALLRHYSGCDQESHQDQFRRVGCASRLSRVLNTKTGSFSRGSSFGPLGSPEMDSYHCPRWSGAFPQTACSERPRRRLPVYNCKEKSRAFPIVACKDIRRAKAEGRLRRYHEEARGSLFKINSDLRVAVRNQFLKSKCILEKEELSRVRRTKDSMYQAEREEKGTYCIDQERS